MKKGSIIALIVAVVLIIGGGILLTLGLSFAGDIAPKSTLTQLEVLIQEPFENIKIDTADCDVTFVPYNGTANAHIVILEHENIGHSVLVEEGTLIIKMMDNRTWTDYVGVNWESMEMTVYLPQAQYDSLWVSTDTGDIRTPAALSAKEIQLRSETGDIYCDSSAAELLDCMTSTGAILARDVAAAVMKLQSSTGDIELQGAAATEIHLSNSTGETELQNGACKTLTCNSSTGDVDLENVLAEEYLQVFTSTGEVEIRNSDTAHINIETSTGDVHVPAAWKSRERRIETDTGSIYYE